MIVETITDRVVVGKGEVEISLLYAPARNDAGRATHSHACGAFLLPGVSVALKSLRPDMERDSGTSIGACLRRRRRELGMLQADAAATLGANEWTYLNWEHETHQPADRFYPAIIAFIGCEPWPEPQSLAEALRAERLRRGLSAKAAAQLSNLDPETWVRCEHSERKATRRTVPKLDQFLGIDVRASYPDCVW